MTTLSPDTLARCYELGRQRDSNHATSRNLNQTREKTHINGLKGELAFAQRYNLNVDTEDRPTGDKYDFKVLWGNMVVSIDVKATRYTQDPWLKVRPNNVKADIYVLAAIDGADVDLVGYATDVAINATEPTTKTGHMENHILEASELRDLPNPERVTKL